MSASPERRRLTRLRWRATALFALATTVCLVVLACFASVIDTRSHTRETQRELGDIAQQLVEAAHYTVSGVTFSSDGVQSWSAVPGTFAYVDPTGIEVASPSQGALPSDAVIDTLVARAGHTRAAVDVDAPTADAGTPFHWVALQVPYTSSVAIAGASAVPTPEHRDLDGLLALTVVALAVLGSLFGHLLSGIAMRPALRGIEEHEQFLREAAHELRTPLAVLELAVTRMPGDRSTTAPIADQVTRMTSLVSRLLDRARIRATSASEVVLEPLRLDQVVELAVEDLPGAEAVHLDLDPVVVDGHAGLLTQAVRNLVENALRYGAAPVVVTVREGRLAVADAGPGIPVPRRRRVLAGGRSGGLGTGTGLSIVGWVARIHGAELRLDAARPSGLVVTLAMPPHAAASRSSHETGRMVGP